MKPVLDRHIVWLYSLVFDPKVSKEELKRALAKGEEAEHDN